VLVQRVDYAEQKRRSGPGRFVLDRSRNRFLYCSRWQLLPCRVDPNHPFSVGPTGGWSQAIIERL